MAAATTKLFLLVAHFFSAAVPLGLADAGTATGKFKIKKVSSSDWIPTEEAPFGEYGNDVMWIKKVSSSDWIPTEEAPFGEYGNDVMCSQFCLLKGDSCVGFRAYDGGRCEVGHLSGGATLYPESGIEVHIRPINATFAPSPEVYINNNYGNNVFGVDSATGAITLLDEPNMRDQGLRDPRAYASYYRGGILACEPRTSGTCKRYTVHKRTWRPVQNIPRLDTLMPTTVTIQNQVWFVGGRNGYVNVFDEDWSWKEGPDYPHPAWYIGVAKVAATEFLTCGGTQVASVYRDECYKMDASVAVADAVWAPADPLPQPMFWPCMAPFTDSAGKSKVLLATASIGAGTGEGAVTDAVYLYDVDTDEWETGKDPFPIMVRMATLFTVNNVVYHAGGRLVPENTVNPAIWRYDPVADSWTDTGNIYNGMASHAIYMGS